MITCTWCWACDDWLEASALLAHHQLAHPEVPLKPPRWLPQVATGLSRFHDPEHPERPHNGPCAGWDDLDRDREDT